jgi:hypothetical protein
MTTSDGPAVLAAITANWLAVVLIGGLSIVAMFVFFIEAARMGRRDRVYPMALWMTVLWWPHDGSYLLHFADWFSKWDHWFMKLFWFAIVVAFLAESDHLDLLLRRRVLPGLAVRRAVRPGLGVERGAPSAGLPLACPAGVLDPAPRADPGRCRGLVPGQRARVSLLPPSRVAHLLPAPRPEGRWWSRKGAHVVHAFHAICMHFMQIVCTSTEVPRHRRPRSNAVNRRIPRVR